MSGDPPPDDAVASAADPEDLVVGAFSENPPWLVDPRSLAWQAGLDALRLRTRAEARALTRRRVLPGTRVVRVGVELGTALGGWYAFGRRGGRSHSRASLSRRLRRSFERLGPTYIKLGQILSSEKGCSPRNWSPNSGSSATRCRPKRSGREPDRRGGSRRPARDLFASVDSVPVAAASIAQVHSARLPTGEEVVVKVQRPIVAHVVGRDLAVMSWLAPLFVGRIPVVALTNPPALVEVFAETIVEELDFRLEAQNMLDVARVLADTGQRALVVPRPHPRLVTRRVLVMERLDGFGWGEPRPCAPRASTPRPSCPTR